MRWQRSFIRPQFPIGSDMYQPLPLCEISWVKLCLGFQHKTKPKNTLPYNPGTNITLRPLLKVVKSLLLESFSNNAGGRKDIFIFPPN